MTEEAPINYTPPAELLATAQDFVARFEAPLAALEAQCHELYEAQLGLTIHERVHFRKARLHFGALMDHTRYFAAGDYEHFRYLNTQMLNGMLEFRATEKRIFDSTQELLGQLAPLHEKLCATHPAEATKLQGVIDTLSAVHGFIKETGLPRDLLDCAQDYPNPPQLRGKKAPGETPHPDVDAAPPPVAQAATPILPLKKYIQSAFPGSGGGRGQY